MVGIPFQALILATKVQDFVRTNLAEFHGSNIYEDLVDLLDEGYRIVAIMGMPLDEKFELVDYKLKGVPNVCYD